LGEEFAVQGGISKPRYEKVEWNESDTVGRRQAGGKTLDCMRSRVKNPRPGGFVVRKTRARHGGQVSVGGGYSVGDTTVNCRKERTGIQSWLAFRCRVGRFGRKKF